MYEWRTIRELRYWVHKVLPLVYDDSLSYYELLNKVVHKLNELIENNSNIPEYVATMIQEFITSGEIESVLANVLSSYILNVKNPPDSLTPATGDGSTDDTEAIQGCIDYANSHGGMAVYFPSGDYLTGSLDIYNGTTLFGYDRYNTRLVLKGGATRGLINGSVDTFTISGIGLDGNADIQVNNVNLCDIACESGIITNAKLTDGHILLACTIGNDLQISDTIFDKAVVKGAVFNGEGYVQGSNLIFNTLSALAGESFIELNNNNSILEQIKPVGNSPVGVTVNGNNNVVKTWKGGCTNAIVDGGNSNTCIVYNDNSHIVGNENITGNLSVDGDADIAGNTIAGGTLTVEGATNTNELNVNPESDVKYKAPSAFTDYFDVLPIKDNEGNVVDLLVKNDDTEKYFDNVGTDGFKLLYPPMEIGLSDKPTGACQAIIVGSHAVLVDMGLYESFEKIKDSLIANGVETIDAVFISHWHADHSGQQFTTDYAEGYNHWKTQFDMTNTVFYVPPVPRTYDPDSNRWLLESFAENEINTITANGEALNWNDIKFEIYNASLDDFAWINENHPDDYNAYSWIVYAIYGQSVICNTSDINHYTSNRAVEVGYAKQSSVVTIPHHGVNALDSGRFAKAVNPIYGYIPNNNVAMANAYRDGFIKAICNNATIFTNAENINGVSFYVTKSGVAASGSPSVVSQYAGENNNTIYVNPDALDSARQLGTYEYPYKYLRRAVSDCKEFTIIELLADTTETIVFNHSNGRIILNGNNHTTGDITIANGTDIEVFNVKCNKAYVVASRAKFEGCEFDDTISISDHSFVYVYNVTVNNDVSAIDCRDSVMTVNIIKTPTRTSAMLFSIIRSFATGNIPLGNLNNTPPYVYNDGSYVDFNRLAEPGSILNTFWSHNKPPLITYDTTVSKYARILSDGTLDYVARDAEAIKQVEVSIPINSVSCPANQVTTLLSNYDLTSHIPSGATAKSIHYMWANGSSTVAVNSAVANNAATLVVYAFGAVTVTSVRVVIDYV